MTAKAKTDSPQVVFPGASFASHMPFFTGTTLLFCHSGPPLEHIFESEGTIWQRMEESPKLRAHFAGFSRINKISFRRWKLYIADWKSRRVNRLETGLPAAAVECSPSFFVQDGIHHVSFIGGMPTRRWIQYGLYQMSGPTLDRLCLASLATDVPTRAGFVGRRYVCTCSGPIIRLRERPGGPGLQLACPLRLVLFVNYPADDEDRLIITGAAENGKVRTLLYDMKSGETWSIEGPDGVYKPSLYANQIVFAKRRGDTNEDRELWHGIPLIAKPEHAIIRVESSSPARSKASV